MGLGIVGVGDEGQKGQGERGLGSSGIGSGLCLVGFGAASSLRVFSLSLSLFLNFALLACSTVLMARRISSRKYKKKCHEIDP